MLLRKVLGFGSGLESESCLPSLFVNNVGAVHEWKRAGNGNGSSVYSAWL